MPTLFLSWRDRESLFFELTSRFPIVVISRYRGIKTIVVILQKRANRTDA